MPATHRGDARRVAVGSAAKVADVAAPPRRHVRRAPESRRWRTAAGLAAAAATVAALAGAAVVASDQDEGSLTTAAGQTVAALPDAPAVEPQAPQSQGPDEQTSEQQDLEQQRAADAERLSRGSDRPAVRTGGPSLAEAKRQSLAGAAGTVGSQLGRAQVQSADLAVAYDDPRDIAREMIGEYGWSSAEFACLDQLYISESAWDVRADNPTSSAYGIPQALPGEKMASAGADWETNPATQIEWGLGYIRDVYGTPCSAMSFKSGNDWY